MWWSWTMVHVESAMLSLLYKSKRYPTYVPHTLCAKLQKNIGAPPPVEIIPFPSQLNCCQACAVLSHPMSQPGLVPVARPGAGPAGPAGPARAAIKARHKGTSIG